MYKRTNCMRVKHCTKSFTCCARSARLKPSLRAWNMDRMAQLSVLTIEIVNIRYVHTVAVVRTNNVTIHKGEYLWALGAQTCCRYQIHPSGLLIRRERAGSIELTRVCTIMDTNKHGAS